jgi:hypothetical protein
MLTFLPTRNAFFFKRRLEEDHFWKYTAMAFLNDSTLQAAELRGVWPLPLARQTFFWLVAVLDVKVVWKITQGKVPRRGNNIVWVSLNAD